MATRLSAAEIEAVPIGRHSVRRGWQVIHLAATSTACERVYIARPWPDDLLWQRLRNLPGQRWSRWQECCGQIDDIGE